MKSPAYQWYPKDILGSQRVAIMDAKTECWYRRALDFCWVHGSVPSDPKKLAAMIGKGCTAKAAAADIVPMFSTHPEDADKLIHDRQDRERAKQKANSQARTDAANARWGRLSTEADTMQMHAPCMPVASGLHMQNGMQKDALQFTSSITNKEEEEERAGAQGFSSEQPKGFAPPPRPSHAPPVEQVQAFFHQQGAPELTDPFLQVNDLKGWTFSTGEKIANWSAWAAGFIKTARKRAAKEAEKKSKPAIPQKHHVQIADSKAVADKYR